MQGKSDFNRMYRYVYLERKTQMNKEQYQDKTAEQAVARMDRTMKEIQQIENRMDRLLYCMCECGMQKKSMIQLFKRSFAKVVLNKNVDSN